MCNSSHEFPTSESVQAKSFSHVSIHWKRMSLIRARFSAAHTVHLDCASIRTSMAPRRRVRQNSRKVGRTYCAGLNGQAQTHIRCCRYEYYMSNLTQLRINLSVADCGDYVVVTNAKDIKVSGRKDEQIMYRKHTMFPGGLKEIKYKDMMRRKPDEVRQRVHLMCILLTSRTDHSSGRLWYVTQKQAAGAKAREAEDIPHRRYGRV